MVRLSSPLPAWRWVVLAPAALATALLGSCGGGNGRDSGAAKTTLRVEARDADGDRLHYHWRVTAGAVDNRDAPVTTWTLPDSAGLHFAYVTITDGRGGSVEQAYAVSSDGIDNLSTPRRPLDHTPPPVVDFDGALLRLRLFSGVDTRFAPAGGGSAALRRVYQPDVRVQVVHSASGDTVHAGITDLSGEISLPKLPTGQAYEVRCATSEAATPVSCGSFVVGAESAVIALRPALNDAQNLRLFGHVALADGSVCGAQNTFFNLNEAATVELLDAGGTPLARPVRVNRFGDYVIDAAVPLRGALRARITCEGYSRTVDVPAPGNAGYTAAAPVELSHAVANTRPAIVKMVANGPEGNVRGQMVMPIDNAASNRNPGADHFLTYKGKDTALSACLYYRSIGAVRDCDAQGRLIEPITLEDWKRQRGFRPYASGTAEVSALYINRMDLGLVRSMTATQKAADDIAFVVCNNPGPEGSSQAEIDATVDTALANQKLVACVAMEWTPTPGVNGGRPYTKFLTFGPDGVLIPSVNLDGRGEKYLPGTCVACHGGTQYNGQFPDRGNPSGNLGSRFLGFDTANYLFASGKGLTEADQSDAIYRLNQLVAATEPSADTATSKLVQGWYAHGTRVLNKDYVPPAWQAADSQPATAGAARFYREVVGVSCRTCHSALGSRFDWDSLVLSPARAAAHVCGGTADLAVNASMPNALMTRDRVAQKVQADPALAALMTTFLGCSEPLPDPVYARR